jgi:hypothetical protein
MGIKYFNYYRRYNPLTLFRNLQMSIFLKRTGNVTLYKHILTMVHCHALRRTHPINSRYFSSSGQKYFSRSVCPTAHSVVPVPSLTLLSRFVCPIAHFVIPVRLSHRSLCFPGLSVPSLTLLSRSACPIAHSVVPVRLSHRLLCCPGSFFPSFTLLFLPVCPLEEQTDRNNRVRDGTSGPGQESERWNKRNGTTE